MDMKQENKKRNYKIAVIVLTVIMILSIIGIVISIVKIVSGDTKKETITVNQVVFSEGEDDIVDMVTNEEEAYNYIAKNADSIGIDDMNNVAYKDTKGSVDSVFYSFQQNYKGIPVYGSHITVMTDYEGNVLMTSADYLPISDETSTSATVTAADLKTSIKNNFEKNYGFNNVKDIKLDELTEERMKVIWHINLILDLKMERAIVVIQLLRMLIVVRF